jgi:hypothetical protein
MSFIKGDLYFHVQEVRKAARFRAVCYAVYTPILGLNWAERGMSWAEETLHHRWRDRLDSLRDAGRDPVQERPGVTFLRNCPPFGVHTPLSNLKCCHDHAVDRRGRPTEKPDPVQLGRTPAV